MYTHHHDSIKTEIEAPNIFGSSLYAVAFRVYGSHDPDSYRVDPGEMSCKATK